MSLFIHAFDKKNTGQNLSDSATKSDTALCTTLNTFG